MLEKTFFGLKRKLALFVVIVIFLATFFAGRGYTPVFATDLSNGTLIEITDFSILDSHGNPIPPGGSISADATFYLKIGWDAANHSNNIHAGDYFILTLPERFRFTKNYPVTFDVLTPDDSMVVAKAEVTPHPTEPAKVKVIFTDYVENKYNVHGDIALAGNIAFTSSDSFGETELVVSISSYVYKKITVPILPPVKPEDETLLKWAAGRHTEGEVEWRVRINHKKAHLTNVTIRDKLKISSGEDDPEIGYIPGSFFLHEVEMDEYGRVTRVLNSQDINADVVLSPDLRSFEYFLGDIPGKQYRLQYKTTYKPGLTLRNEVELESKKVKKTLKTYYYTQQAEGHGVGDEFGSLKIIKVDASNATKKIKGAKFIITKLSDNTEITETTDENGEIFSKNLVPGQYKIKEIFVPAEYVLDPTEQEVTITKGNVEVRTIKNKLKPSGGFGGNTPEKTKISVKKRWDGKILDSVTVHLFANGKKIASKEITKAMGWTYEFTDLDKHDAGGNEIKYTIAEDALGGYDSKIEGNADDGFLLINKEIPPPDKKIKPDDKIKPNDQKPIEIPEDKVTNKKILPKTGNGLDPSNYAIIFAVVGLIILIAGIARYRHGKKI